MFDNPRMKTDKADQRMFKRFWDRLDCFIHGHRELAPADAFAEELPDLDQDKELHYCGACGSPVWVAHRRRHERFHWQAHGADDHLAAGAF